MSTTQPAAELASATEPLSTTAVEPLSTTEPAVEPLGRRPKRADARRNYDRILAAAREAFSRCGAATSLEEIARCAGVGIGTLYRHFPTRQALLEALYIEELEDVCRSACERDAGDPWEDLVGWLRRLVAYLATKHALAEELFEYLDRDAPIFQSCRAALFAAGGPLLERAQRAGVLRDDVRLDEVVQMIGAISKIPTADPHRTEHMLEIVLDGLRARA
jgi:AcrR family transcriptional regulator